MKSQDTDRETFGISGILDNCNADINMREEVMFELTPLSRRRSIALNLYRHLASIPKQKYTVSVKMKKRFRPLEGNAKSNLLFLMYD
jgi:hypothetical protein